MKTQSTQVLQKSILKAFPGSFAQTLSEALFLFFTGVLAMALHAKLRIPMHLPGKQGLLFMFIVIGASLLSKFRFSTLLVTTGAASLLLTGFGGFEDPFMPVHYLLLGFAMDLLLSFKKEISIYPLFVAVAGGLSFSVIPLSRALLSLGSGIPYPSLMNGILLPWSTHFLFGLSGSLLAILAVKTLSEKE